jgi:hypothetical protein
MIKLIRTKNRVQTSGEVFTPKHIVYKMTQMVPNDLWAKKDCIFLEPTCGNGQIIETIFLKRLECGLSYEEAINTIWGMDIHEDNINECHMRLYNILQSKFLDLNISQIARFIVITENNIYTVKDSLQSIKDGNFTSKSFVFTDPTGNNQIIEQKFATALHNRTITSLVNRCEDGPISIFYNNNNIGIATK